MDDRDTRRLSLRIPADVYAQLEAAAFLEGKTLRDIVLPAIDQAVRSPTLQGPIQEAVRLKRERAVRFSGPALLGPDGSALREGTAGYERLDARVRGVSDEILKRIADSPHLLREMHWRDFEQLVAELFARDGFDVALTPASGDEGVDLYAARHTGLGSLLYVVQCKRWAQERPVGPDIVLALKGAIDRDGASGGVLATTSYFTPGARKEQRKLRWRVSLKGFHDLHRWTQGSPIFDHPPIEHRPDPGR
jgi:restriction endonuclease Mrr